MTKQSCSRTQFAARWIVRLICCGRDDGEERFATWEEADRFRESYTDKVGVAPHGYSADESESGHRRAGIIRRAQETLFASGCRADDQPMCGSST